MRLTRQQRSYCSGHDSTLAWLLATVLALMLATCSSSGEHAGVAAAPTGTEGKNMGTQLVANAWQSTLEKGMWIVEFYSPYCHHCRDFAPTWATLVEMHGHLADSHNFHFGRVDCVAQGDLCADNKIKGYPTMRIFEEGKFTREFKGERSYARVSEFVLSNANDYRAGHADRPDNPDQRGLA